jgi:Ca2+-binding EF-hand superfamily protein
VPDSLPFEVRRQGRNTFIAQHLWQLFDSNHDGRMSFDEYLNSEWAGFLAQLPAGQCRVTKTAYLMSFLGSPDGPNSWWKLPYQLQIFTNMYHEMDKTNKGYITKDDIKARAARSFRYSDKRHQGYLTRDELG